MKPAARVAFLAVVLCVAGAPASAQNRIIEDSIVPDLATAVVYAEKAIVDMIGGADKIETARPWEGSLHSNNWVIISRPMTNPDNPSGPKRALVVTVSQKGEILDISPF